MVERARRGYVQIVKRQVPHAVLSWRYFVPGQHHMVQLHKRSFLALWTTRPWVLWSAVALYSYAVWYFFYAWRQSLGAWRRHSANLLLHAGVPRARQARDLLVLALLHSTPPVFYYRYRLYAYPEQQWLNFVYTHELPHWHRILSPDIGDRSQSLMTQKNDFSVEMARRGLPSVPTHDRVEVAEAMSKDTLFRQRSVFLKPDVGSRKGGCYALVYQPNTRAYHLQGAHHDRVISQDQILDYLGKNRLAQVYLLQPLLKNHSRLEAHFQITALIVVRIVTVMVSGAPKAICARLEVPIEGQFEYVNSFKIDLETGRLCSVADDLGMDHEATQRLNVLSQFDVPFWSAVVSLAEKAHQSFGDIYSVGWDIAITPDGLRLIEGNLNWAVAVHQRHGDVFNLQA